MHRPVIYRCASKEALQLEAWPFGVGGTLITILVAWFWEGESCNSLVDEVVLPTLQKVLC